MALQHSTITYIVGHQEKENIRLPIYSSLKFPKKSVSKFYNSMHLLINLSGFERVYLDYLCEPMNDETNVVHIDTHTKREFLDALKTRTQKIRGLELVKNAVKKLKKNNLLIDLHSKSIYVVNPRYFYKSSEEKRKTIIKKYIEWIFSHSQENESNYREAFGISKDVINLAKGLKHFPLE